MVHGDPIGLVRIMSVLLREADRVRKSLGLTLGHYKDTVAPLFHIRRIG